MKDNYRTVLITGASAGIGKALAFEFASHGHNLILVARREELLRDISEEIVDKYGVAVDHVAADLLQDDAPQDILEYVRKNHLPVDILINNAGMGGAGDFADVDWTKSKNNITLNVMATTEMDYLFLNHMRERGSGLIVNIASTLAFAPTAGESVYAASKAYLLSLGQALYEETKGSPVKVLTVCPGVTKTEFFDQAGFSLNQFNAATPESFASFAYKQIMKEKPLSIHRFSNRATALFTRLAPRGTVRRAFAAFCRTQ